MTWGGSRLDCLRSEGPHRERRVSFVNLRALRGERLKTPEPQGSQRYTKGDFDTLNASRAGRIQSIPARNSVEDFMEFDLQQTIALLSRTPSTLNALLRDLPQTWTLGNEGGKSWRPFDIVGHLIHGERTDWMTRARIILQHGDTRPFDPFDRLAQERESQGKSLGELLDEFARLRAENLDELRAMNLQPSDFDRRGRHP